MESNLSAGFNAAPRQAWIANTTAGVLVKVRRPLLFFLLLLLL